MKISYKGVKKELSPKLQEKLDAKFAKLSKLLDRRGERGAHVIVTSERHLHHAEITVQYYDHPLVGIGSDADLFTALSTAVDKLEAQAHKQSAKWREKKRRKEAPVKGEPELVGVVAISGSSLSEDRGVQRVYKVNHTEDRKPMTLEEALLEMEGDRDYLVYQDADKQRVSVLVRRRDGHIDLIEG